jgi:TolA-binding protein
MGECWYGLRNYPRAISAFETVLERFPKGNKAPDALLKKAFSLQRSGKPREALAALHDLIQRYPRTPSAAKAQDKVKEIESQS